MIRGRRSTGEEPSDLQQALQGVPGLRELVALCENARRVADVCDFMRIARAARSDDPHAIIGDEDDETYFWDM